MHVVLFIMKWVDELAVVVAVFTLACQKSILAVATAA